MRYHSNADEAEYQLAKKENGCSVSPHRNLCLAPFVQSLPAAGKAPWMRYAGFVESGDPASSRSVDDVVYGAKD
jgi:hypothetical protein